MNNNHAPSGSNTFVASITAIVFAACVYTAMGVVVGTLWVYGTSSIPGIVTLSLTQVIALWWVWILVLLPPIMFAVNYLRVTDVTR